ncbi:MAG TPA: hypothetical protein VFB66_08675 [Tepidisphaeraceae bacterium]|nr:hypothetical protein [Tepidisphaeraceae bacterium]
MHLTLDEGGTVRVWDARDGAPVARLAHDGGVVQRVIFSPDGATLATCGPTGNPVHLWETATWRLRRRLTVPRAPAADDPQAMWDAVLPRRAEPVELTSTELEQLWAQLALEDAAGAYDAVCTLAASPARAVPFLATRLSRGRPVDERRVRELIDDLDDDRFTVRERAVKEIGEIGDAAEPYLRELLERRDPRPSPETVQRAEVLLQHFRSSAGAVADADTLRALRAVEVLERAATPSARETLKRLADGRAGLRVKRRAGGALERLRPAQPLPEPASRRSARP